MEMGGLDPHGGCTAPGPTLLCGGPALQDPHREALPSAATAAAPVCKGIAR